MIQRIHIPASELSQLPAQLISLIQQGWFSLYRLAERQSAAYVLNLGKGSFMLLAADGAPVEMNVERFPVVDAAVSFTDPTPTESSVPLALALVNGLS